MKKGSMLVNIRCPLPSCFAHCSTFSGPILTCNTGKERERLKFFDFQKKIRLAIRMRRQRTIEDSQVLREFSPGIRNLEVKFEALPGGLESISGLFWISLELNFLIFKKFFGYLSGCDHNKRLNAIVFYTILLIFLLIFFLSN